jgi:hypothetical protein
MLETFYRIEPGEGMEDLSAELHITLSPSPYHYACLKSVGREIGREAMQCMQKNRFKSMC